MNVRVCGQIRHLPKLPGVRTRGREENTRMGGRMCAKPPPIGENSSRRCEPDQPARRQAALESAEISATTSRSTGTARSAKASSTRATGPDTETAVGVGMSGTAIA